MHRLAFAAAVAALAGCPPPPQQQTVPQLAGRGLSVGEGRLHRLVHPGRAGRRAQRLGDAAVRSEGRQRRRQAAVPGPRRRGRAGRGRAGAAAARVAAAAGRPAVPGQARPPLRRCDPEQPEHQLRRRARRLRPAAERRQRRRRRRRGDRGRQRRQPGAVPGRGAARGRVAPRRDDRLGVVATADAGDADPGRPRAGDPEARLHVAVVRDAVGRARGRRRSRAGGVGGGGQLAAGRRARRGVQLEERDVQRLLRAERRGQGRRRSRTGRTTR